MDVSKSVLIGGVVLSKGNFYQISRFQPINILNLNLGLQYFDFEVARSISLVQFICQSLLILAQCANARSESRAASDLKLALHLV